MITKGQITAINNTSNTYTVRIPLFEGAGNTLEFTTEAIASVLPGIYNGYQIGDVVELGFEENSVSNAVILGKLYLGVNTESTKSGGAGKFDTLEATNKAVLPNDTTIGGTSLKNIVDKITNISTGSSSEITLDEYLKSATATDTTLTLVNQNNNLITFTPKGAIGPKGDQGPKGEDGSNGYNTTVIRLYKRSSSTITIDWDYTIDYTFSTNTLSIIPSGWSTSEPTGEEPLYMTAATATSQEDTDTIAVNEWCAPVKLVSNGIDGTNTATVFLFQRFYSEAESPAKPTSDLTYTFTTGSLTGDLGNWSQTIPESTSDKKPCYSIQATAASISSTDIISPSEWSAPVIYAQDGENGTSISIKSSEAECTKIGDGYIDSDGHLQILTVLDPRTFKDAGQIKGPKGDDGASAIRLDIQNDFDSVPCTSDGAISETYDWLGQTTHTLAVYIGTTSVNFKVIKDTETIPKEGTVVTYQESGVVFKAITDITEELSSQQAYITGFADTESDKIKTGRINYTVYVNGVKSATSKFEAVRQYAGANGNDGDDGEDAVDCWITSTATNLKLSKTKTVNPQSVIFNFYKKQGTKETELYEGYYTYKWDNETEESAIAKASIVTISTKDATCGLQITLWTDENKTTKYDTEHLQLIEDGEDGDNGKDGDNGHSIETTLYWDGSNYGSTAPTESDFMDHGTFGTEQTWTDSSTLRNNCKTDDLFLVTGVASDTNVGHTITFKCLNDTGDLKGTVMSHMYTVGIISMTGQFALSTSKETAPEESSTDWKDTMPEYVEDNYLWHRTKCIKSNGGITYINIYCDTNWHLVHQYNTQFINYKTDTDAKMALVVSDTTEGNKVNTASIVAAINDKESTAEIQADKITMTGEVRFVKPEDIGSYDSKTGVTTISGDKITTGELNASLITAGTLDASRITVKNFDASSINTGSLNASLITTGSLDANLITTGAFTVVDEDKNVLFSANVSGHKVYINGNCIVNGSVTFNSLDEDTQDTITTAQTSAKNAQVAADDAKSKTDGLSTGSTTINGGCITTGVIQSANYEGETYGTSINLETGSISSKNFSIDSKGNATFSGTVSGGTIEGGTIRIKKDDDSYFTIATDGGLACGNGVIRTLETEELTAYTINGANDGGISRVEVVSDLFTWSYTSATSLTDDTICNIGEAKKIAGIAQGYGGGAPSGEDTEGALYFQIIS